MEEKKIIKLYSIESHFKAAWSSVAKSQLLIFDSEQTISYSYCSDLKLELDFTFTILTIDKSSVFREETLWFCSPDVYQGLVYL